MFLSNYTKEYFKNVYFITGCAMGGKTTISKAIAEKYGFIRYDADAEFDKHKKLSNASEQPAMNKQFKNADDFFLRDIAEYVQWLKDNTTEQLPFILNDIIKLSQSNKVVCDLHLSVNEAKQIANNNQIVFLIRENNNDIINDYCQRESHSDFNAFINSATNPIHAKQNCNEVLRKLNTEQCHDIKTSDFFWIARNSKSTVSDTLKAVEKHFGLII
ncbi:MAG: shikimate kinase [Clostridiales bacterium]|nr:shikimate kinase [Clostridiales bacterium]